ncbi:MAG TPA: LuxR C-terminal-related transcriptional regulator [Actinomycetes bacterium]
MPRTDLLERLKASSAVPVVAIVAPPGYGKTTLLKQWAERDPRPFAWLSVDRHGDDPTTLLTDVAALCREEPGVVVLDDAHRLQHSDGLGALVELARHLRGASQVVLAGRAQPPLPVARLRAEGGVVEIGPDDLAMDQDEASSLLRRVEVDVSEADVAELTRRTEGWPVALHLAGLSLRMRSPQRPSTAWVADSRFVVDHLRSVLLEGLDDEHVRFLTRTSVLDRLSGPLCDAVLERSGSGKVLESLERSRLLLVPLDRNRWWYRYHQLFQELLRSELERREPGLAGALTRRAAQWCERNGLPEDAVEYAMQAGDADRVARLVLEAALSVYNQGRAATLQRWLDWFEDQRLVQRYPGIAVLGAWVHLLAGHPADAERWADEATGGSLEEPLPDGSASLDGWLAVLQAGMCRQGAERMGKDAAIALERLPVSSPWRARALLLPGISQRLTGDIDGADTALARAAEVAEDLGAAETVSVALAERATLAMDRDDSNEPTSLAGRAGAVVRDHRLDDYASSTLLYAVGARLAIHRGDMPAAREHLDRAERLRPRCTEAVPFYGVQTVLELIRARTALMDVRGAKDLLREVDDALHRWPDLGVLREQADELAARLDTIRTDVVVASLLTAAELRLLPQLATYRCFREIGERMDLSPHTVKTQAISIYRKFGVSSRSGAIRRAQDLGLLLG